MNNPRENIKYDIPKEWIINFKKGLCPVCGKTKFEFDKNMKVYCSKKCQIEYSARIYTWQSLVDKILNEKGKVCVKCGITDIRYTINQKENKKLVIEKYIEEHPELVELKRKELMDKAEMYYQLALKFDEIIKSKEYEKLDWNCKIDIPYDLYKKFDNNYINFEVDHKVAVCNSGDFWDENNLQVLCYTCHKEKTKIDLKIKGERNENKEKNNKSYFT